MAPFTAIREAPDENREMSEYVLGLTQKAESREMTVRQLAVLMLLASENERPWTVRALAKRTGFSKPVITRAMNALSKLGFIIRTKDMTDGRSVLLSITLRGQDFMFV